MEETKLGCLTMVLVVASGYFNPLHKGHIEYLEKAATLGDRLVVIVNNDVQACLKKGSTFMGEGDRIAVVRALRCVDAAIIASDSDRTVCATLRQLRPDIFANGGDQFNTGIPEAPVCEELGITMVDGLGAKIQSSSSILAGRGRAAAAAAAAVPVSDDA